MNFSVRWICGKYAELTVEDGNVTLTSSALNEKERKELAAELADAADDLLRH